MLLFSVSFFVFGLCAFVFLIRVRLGLVAVYWLLCWFWFGILVVDWHCLLVCLGWGCFGV